MRLTSNSELRHQQWNHLSWGIQKDNEDIPHKRRCPQLPSVLVDILHLLKKRNPVYDYIVASGIKKEGVPWKNVDALPDFSSYLAVCTSHQYHNVTRIGDSLWAEVKSAFIRFHRRFYLQAIVLSLWVFTRHIPFIRFLVDHETMFGDEDDLFQTLMAFSDLLKAKFDGWKQSMKSRSRDYSINTSSLICWHDRWILRAVTKRSFFLKASFAKSWGSRQVSTERD